MTMNFGIATVSLSGTLEEKLRAAAAAGCRGVEIFETDLVASLLSPREVRDLLGELGLACLLYQPLRDIEGMPPLHRQLAFDRAEAKFDLMGELGAVRILLCSNCSPMALPDRERIVDDLAELGERAAVPCITIGYEALAWGRHVYDHRDAWAIVAAVDRPNVGIILDSFHSLARGVPNDSIRAIAGDRIAFVQLADAPPLTMDLLQWSRHWRNLPGQGGLDLAGFVAAVLDADYRGPLSLEIFNDRFRASSGAMVVRDGIRSLTFIVDAAGRRRDAPAAMPALRGVGGSLVYIVGEDEADSLWAREFAITGAIEDKADPRRIDHLAASVASDEFLLWQLYWRSLFAVLPGGEQDIADPSGLVHSVAIQTRDGAFRVTMNASDARDTLSSRFLQQGFGDGYQHIGLAVDDLAALAEDLIDGDCPLLTVGDNYYAYIEAGFGLDEVTVAARHILYDEEPGGGRYQRLYTRAFDKRFFEFVERSNYGGYGAANAPIRLAGQNWFRPTATVN